MNRVHSGPIFDEAEHLMQKMWNVHIYEYCVGQLQIDSILNFGTVDPKQSYALQNPFRI